MIALPLKLCICLMLSATILVAQHPVYPVLYGETILTKGVPDKTYHPLYEVTNLTKTEIISFWDELNGGWVPVVTASNSHDANCSQILSKGLKRAGFINSVDSFTYVNNRLASRTNIREAVVAKYRYLGTRTVPDTLIWDNIATNSGLIYTFTYDANNLPASVNIKKRVGATLSDSLRATYQHNTATHLTALKGEIFNGTQWVLSRQDTFVYNADNKIIKFSSVLPNTTYEWVCNYDVSKRPTHAVANTLFNGQLRPTSRILVPANRYSSNGYPTELIQQEANGVKWDTFTRSTFTYNGAFSMTNATYQLYSNGILTSTAEKRDWTYCGQRVGTNDPRMNEKALVLSPNPVTEQLTVHLEAENPMMTVQIFDNLGKNVLQTQSNQMQTTVSIGHMSSGIYIVRVQSGADWAVKKFLKL
jgi:hypothetical protein